MSKLSLDDQSRHWTKLSDMCKVHQGESWSERIVIMLSLKYGQRSNAALMIAMRFLCVASYLRSALERERARSISDGMQSIVLMLIKQTTSNLCATDIGVKSNALVCVGRY